MNTVEYKGYGIIRDNTGYAPKDMQFEIYLEERCIGSAGSVEDCKKIIDEIIEENDPEIIKLFEGGEEERTELLPDVAYWRHRCLLVEKCLSVSPCDPDITEEQIKAHKDYNQYLETFGNKD